jgi:hypothetical protein
MILHFPISTKGIHFRNRPNKLNSFSAYLQFGRIFPRAMFFISGISVHLAYKYHSNTHPALRYERERKVWRQVCALKRQSITCIIVDLLHISKCWELFLQRCATLRSTHGRLMNKHWNAHRWSKVMPVYFLQNATFIRQASLFFKTVMLLGRPFEHWMRPAQ